MKLMQTIIPVLLLIGMLAAYAEEPADVTVPTPLIYRNSLNQPAPELVVSFKDAKQPLYLENIKGSAVLILGYLFSGVPVDGVEADPHC